MKTRHFAVAAVSGIVVLGVAGCSSPEPALGGTTATVTIDGKDTGGAHPVTCRQSGWSWFIDTPQKDQGFSAVLGTDGPAKAKTVTFRDFGGFTGNFWADNIGDADVTGHGGHFTISGTADGSFTDSPSDTVSAKFRIQANC